MKVKILVASHKESPMPADKDLYLPILVGANKNYNGQKGFQLDNTGYNISNKNPNYNELTAIYWAWKNLSDVDAIGLVHYRRFFSFSHKRNLNEVLDKAEVEKLLKRAPVVLPKKRDYIIESNYSHYKHAHEIEPLNVTGTVISNEFPQYFKAFERVLNSRKAHMFNMFIMRKDYFDSYCEFLFRVLSSVENQIDISEYSTQEKRVFGYISELLMDVWIETNNVKYTECNWIQLGKRNLIPKAYGFLKRKFISNGGTTHY